MRLPLRTHPRAARPPDLTGDVPRSWRSRGRGPYCDIGRAIHRKRPGARRPGPSEPRRRGHDRSSHRRLVGVAPGPPRVPRRGLARGPMRPLRRSMARPGAPRTASMPAFATMGWSIPSSGECALFTTVCSPFALSQSCSLLLSAHFGCTGRPPRPAGPREPGRSGQRQASRNLQEPVWPVGRGGGGGAHGRRAACRRSGRCGIRPSPRLPAGAAGGRQMLVHAERDGAVPAAETPQG